MEESNVALKVLLSLFKDPLLEVDEVKGMRVVDFASLQPFNVERKVVWNFFAVEYSVDHMAAKQPHLDLVSSVRVNLTILMDRLKYVAGSRTITEFEVIE